VLDAVLERVVEAQLTDWTALADLAGTVDADAVAREERGRMVTRLITGQTRWVTR
jgi:hypothetical protein